MRVHNNLSAVKNLSSREGVRKIERKQGTVGVCVCVCVLYQSSVQA